MRKGSNPNPLSRRPPAPEAPPKPTISDNGREVVHINAHNYHTVEVVIEDGCRVSKQDANGSGMLRLIVSAD